MRVVLCRRRRCSACLRAPMRASAAPAASDKWSDLALCVAEEHGRAPRNNSAWLTAACVAVAQLVGGEHGPWVVDRDQGGS